MKRENNELKGQLHAAANARSLAEKLVCTLEWIQNLGAFQQVEEEEDEDKGFSSINEGLLQNTLKTLFRLSGVLLGL